MNLAERVELFNKKLSIQETLATEVKELPRYGRECCMDANADTTQAEFEQCEEHQSWIDIVVDDGSDLITFKHCIVCGGEYKESEW